MSAPAIQPPCTRSSGHAVPSGRAGRRVSVYGSVVMVVGTPVSSSVVWLSLFCARYGEPAYAVFNSWGPRLSVDLRDIIRPQACWPYIVTTYERHRSLGENQSQDRRA